MFKPAEAPMPRTEAVTIYHRGEFGGAYRRIEVRWAEISRRKYAQYPSAAQVVFMQKRKRKARYFMETSHPTAVVLRGHGHFEPSGTFGPAHKSESGCLVSQSRHSMFSRGFDADFEMELQAYLAAHPETEVIRDFRQMSAYEAIPEETPEPEKAEGMMDRA